MQTRPGAPRYDQGGAREGHCQRARAHSTGARAPQSFAANNNPTRGSLRQGLPHHHHGAYQGPAACVSSANWAPATGPQIGRFWAGSDSFRAPAASRFAGARAADTPTSAEATPLAENTKHNNDDNNNNNNDINNKAAGDEQLQRKCTIEVLEKNSFVCTLVGSRQCGKQTIVKCFVKLLNEFKLAACEYKNEKLLARLIDCSEKLQRHADKQQQQHQDNANPGGSRVGKLLSSLPHKTRRLNSMIPFIGSNYMQSSQQQQQQQQHLAAQASAQAAMVTRRHTAIGGHLATCSPSGLRPPSLFVDHHDDQVGRHFSSSPSTPSHDPRLAAACGVPPEACVRSLPQSADSSASSESSHSTSQSCQLPPTPTCPSPQSFQAPRTLSHSGSESSGSASASNVAGSSPTSSTTSGPESSDCSPVRVARSPSARRHDHRMSMRAPSLRPPGAHLLQQPAREVNKSDTQINYARPLRLAADAEASVPRVPYAQLRLQAGDLSGTRDATHGRSSSFNALAYPSRQHSANFTSFPPQASRPAEVSSYEPEPHSYHPEPQSPKSSRAHSLQGSSAMNNNSNLDDNVNASTICTRRGLSSAQLRPVNQYQLAAQSSPLGLAAASARPVLTLKELNRRKIRIKFNVRRQISDAHLATSGGGCTSATPSASQPSRRRQQATRRRQADCFMVVYAVNDRHSFESAKTLVSQLTREQQAHLRSPVILVANKIDLERAKAVKSEEGKSVALKNGCKFIEISCTIGFNLDNLLAGIRTQLILKHHAALNYILKHGKLMDELFCDNGGSAMQNARKSPFRFNKSTRDNSADSANANTNGNGNGNGPPNSAFVAAAAAAGSANGKEYKTNCSGRIKDNTNNNQNNNHNNPKKSHDFNILRKFYRKYIIDEFGKNNNDDCNNFLKL